MNAPGTAGRGAEAPTPAGDAAPKPTGAQIRPAHLLVLLGLLAIEVTVVSVRHWWVHLLGDFHDLSALSDNTCRRGGRIRRRSAPPGSRTGQRERAHDLPVGSRPASSRGLRRVRAVHPVRGDGGVARRPRGRRLGDRVGAERVGGTRAVGLDRFARARVARTGAAGVEGRRAGRDRGCARVDRQSRYGAPVGQSGGRDARRGRARAAPVLPRRDERPGAAGDWRRETSSSTSPRVAPGTKGSGWSRR